MAEPSVLRLLTLRPVGSDSVVDSALRRLSEGPLAGRPLSGFIAGRRHDKAGERVVASTWESIRAMTAALGDASEHGPARPELLDETADVRVEVLPIAVAFDFGRDGSPTVLRIYRGRIRAGELDAYIQEVRTGTIADATAEHGPHTLALGVDPPDRFITVSTWGGWRPIEIATGGNIRNPVATRHAHRLLDGTAHHYEILPNPAGETLPVASGR